MLIRNMSPPHGLPGRAVIRAASAVVRTALIAQRNAYMQKTYVSWGWTHGLGLIGSDSLARTHGLVLIGSDSWAPTHWLGLNGPDSLARTHWLGLMGSDSLARTHGLVLIG